MKNKQIRVTLMNKNTPVVDFEYDTEYNIITNIYYTYPENEKYAPLSAINIETGINRINLMNWFKNRIIPETRDGINEYIEKYNYNYNAFMTDIISKRHGFNLSDQYWFKLQNEQLTWEEGNFFINDFDETTGKKIINKNTYSSSIPSSSTNGNLYKKWIIENKKRYLLKGSSGIKQEPYNELIATNLYKRLLKENEYVNYELYKDLNTNKILSKCECFITPETELVPAWDIIKSLKQKNEETNYEFFLRCSQKLNIPNVKDYMNKLLTCDYILGNSDRHYNNFGAIRNVETLEYISMSPIFDTGNSLGIIKNNENELTTAPFYKEPKKQLKLVDDLSWFDLSKLDNFTKETENILKMNTLLSEEYISKQIEELNTRIKDVVEYKKELEN